MKRSNKFLSGSCCRRKYTGSFRQNLNTPGWNKQTWPAWEDAWPTQISKFGWHIDSFIHKILQWAQQSIKNILEDVSNFNLAYTTHNDICSVFPGETLLAIRVIIVTTCHFPFTHGSHLESSHATKVIPHFNIGACTGETTPFGDKLHYWRDQPLHYT